MLPLLFRGDETGPGRVVLQRGILTVFLEYSERIYPPM